jgi:hypothetical protein
MPPIVILESNPISGIGAVSFTLQNQPAENNLIIAIIVGGVAFGTGTVVAPFEDVYPILGLYETDDGTRVVACRYNSSQGMTLDAIPANTTTFSGTNITYDHWIGYYYVIQCEGSTVAGAFDTSATVVNQNYGQQPYFPFHYNQALIPFTGNGYYTFPSYTPSENTALIIAAWQTSQINDPGPQVTEILDPLNSNNIWTLDCSTVYLNPDEQAYAVANGNESGTTGPNAYDDSLYVGHLNIDNQTPIPYTAQMQFSGDGGPLNNIIQSFYTLFYDLSSPVMIIKNDSATPTPPSGPSTYTISQTDTLPTFNENVTVSIIPNLPCTYSIQGFILPDTNIVYKPVLVVIDDDTVVAEFKQTLNYSPLNQ